MLTFLPIIKFSGLTTA